MSLVQQLISAVMGAQRQIDDNLAQLRAFSKQIDNVTAHVNETLSGSQREFGQNMLQQLSLTKTQVTETINKLEAAKRKLTQVRTI